MATATRPKPAKADACPNPRAKRTRRKKTEATVYTVIVTREADGKHYSAYSPALDGCGSFGHTLPECLQMTEEAIRLCLDCRRELGWPIAPDDPRVVVDMSESQEAFVYRLTDKGESPALCLGFPGVNARETIAALRRAGFEVMRFDGSHTFLADHLRKRSAVVPEHGGRDLTLGTLHSTLRQAGLTVDEFIAVLK